MRPVQLTHRQRWASFLLIFLLFLSGFYMQSQLYLSPDVTWLLRVAGKILNGAQYGRDIFETNPPMILWLSMPSVLIQRIFHADMHRVFLVYIDTLTFFSVLLCFSLLERAYPEHKKNMAVLSVTLTLTAAVLFLPLYAFGQRDILWLILMLPWMGSAVCRLNRQPVPVWQAITAGLFAGVGFALKPYFLCALCLVELYVIYRSRHLFGWWRTETALILAVFVLYLVAIVLLQPGYFVTVLPLVMRYYFISAYQPWTVVLSLPYAVFAVSTALYYVCFRSHDRYPVLGRVLLLVLLGTILSYGLARTPWYYHSCPALIMGCVVLVYITLQMAAKLRNVLFPSAVAGLMLYSPLAALTNSLPEARLVIQQLDPVSRIIHAVGETGTAVNAMSLHTLVDTLLPVEMAGAEYVTGMPFFWWYGGLVTAEMNHLQPMGRLEQDRQFLTDLTAQEVLRTKPQLLLINGAGTPLIYDRLYRRHTLAWFQNLMLNPHLREAFHCYRFYALSGKFLIYQRADACSTEQVSSKSDIYHGSQRGAG